MKLTDRILQMVLQEKYPDITAVHIGLAESLQGPLFYEQGMEMETGWVYIADCPEQLPPSDQIPAGLLIISGEMEPERIPEGTAALLIPELQSGASVFNLVVRAYQRYAEWSKKLSDLSADRGSVEEMIQVSQDIFRNPVFIFRNDMTVLYSTDIDHMPSAYHVFDPGSEKMDLINSLMQDPEFHRQRNNRECYWGPDYILGFRSLNFNVYKGGEMTYCIALMEYNCQLNEGYVDLLKLLVHQIGYLLFDRDEVRNHRDESLHRLFLRILSDRTLDYVDASRQLAELGWQMEHEYLCLVFQITYLNNEHLPVNSVCSYVEDEFRDSISFPFGEIIVAFFNLTKMGQTKDDLSSRLAQFIRDSYLKAGYSRVMEGHMNLRRQYIQASIALEVGCRKRPYVWIHQFDQIAMTYIMEQITRRLPGHMLCHPGILELNQMDEEGGSDYVRTLRTFLDMHQNVVHTANELFIHRSTLIYRLDKIKKVLDSELDDPEELLYLDLSLRLLETADQ